MTLTGDGDDSALRQDILAAALAEVVEVWDLDDFTLEGVAARVGVAPLTIKQFWPNTPALFTATLMTWGERNIPIPDTGTLRGDLSKYSLAFAKATNTPLGRRLLDRVVISPRDWDTSDSRTTFRAARPSRMAVMVRRAIERGECGSDTDPALVVELLASALCTPLIYDGVPISEDYCTKVVDLFLYGLERRK